MNDDQTRPSQTEPDEPAPAVKPATGPPGWLLFARIVAVLVVVALVAGSVLLLRKPGPRVITLHGGDATPALASAGSLDSTTPADTPDGRPLGVFQSGAPKAGQPAPNFALLDLNGRRVALSDLRGKAVVVNFWATWCGPCKQEFPELQKAASSMSNDVVILALDQAESAGKVAQFRDEFGATFTILLDSSNQVADAWRLSGIPDTVFIDRNGIVRDVAFGPLSASSFRYKITQTLNAQ
ncbi:MAG: TlpA family protein disulfide reductase [Dehalococcoidia bacterium]